MHLSIVTKRVLQEHAAELATAEERDHGGPGHAAKIPPALRPSGLLSERGQPFRT